MQKPETDKRIYTMAEEKPVAAVLRMGLPVTLGMLCMVFYNLTDTYFIGKLNDDNQLAATSLSYPIMMLIIAFAGIVGNGGASYIARCIGAGKQDEARHTLTVGLELILFCTAIITVVGMLLLNPLVTLLGAKDETFAFTKEYVKIMLLGSGFTMGNYAIGQLLRSEGSTAISMVGMIVGNVVNIILDPVFIFYFGMEVKGAAIATILGNIAGVLVFVLYYVSGKTMLRPSLRMLRLDKTILKEIFLVGTPHTLEQLFTTMAMVVNNNLVAAYNPQTVAAMGISNKVMSFGSYLYQGMAAGTQPLMGYNYGAKNYVRMKQLFRAGILVITTGEVMVMTGLGIAAPLLIDAFTDSAEVIAIGSRTLRAAMLMLPFVGTTSLARNTFNSMGKPMYAFGITVVRQLILYIPFLLLFDSLWGYAGLIHAQPVEEALCMVLSILLLRGKLNRLAAG